MQIRFKGKIFYMKFGINRRMTSFDVGEGIEKGLR